MNFLSFTFFCVLCQGLFSVPFANSAKILIFHHLASFSHRVPTFVLAEELSKRGHEVTFISPYYPKNPNENITEIVPVKLKEYIEKIISSDFDISSRLNKQLVRLIDAQFILGLEVCETLYSSPEFIEYIRVTKKVDLVIMDSCSPECGVGLAHKLSAKSIIFTTVAPFAHEYDAFGYVPESASIPEMEIDLPTVPMGFFSRLSNALTSLQWHLYHSLYSAKIDQYIRDTLKVPEMPYIGDLIKNVDLIFSTGDVITDYPRALPPNFVNVAGIHCKESTQALPKEIENFLSKNETTGEPNPGFIYISLGSLVISSDLPDSTKQVFFDTIKSFPELKFLWKWNGEFPKKIPENLFLSKWFPQADILGHPRIKAFVTQNGRPSTLEALFNGVPYISFPVIGDQDFNANRLVEVGASTKLEISAVTLEEFKAAIRKAVYDPKTKARMTTLQKAFRDKPMSPLDTAVWYTEYVLRTEDTAHLRPAGRNQNWFVRRQIDVWAFLSIGLFLILTISTAIIVQALKIIFTTQPKLKNA